MAIAKRFSGLRPVGSRSANLFEGLDIPNLVKSHTLFWHHGNIDPLAERYSLLDEQPIVIELAALGRARHNADCAEEVWKRVTAPLRNSEGLLPKGGAPELLDGFRETAMQAYLEQEKRFHIAVTSELVSCILEALEMAGVTDQGRALRIVRNVVGGTPPEDRGRVI